MKKNMNNNEPDNFDTEIDEEPEDEDLLSVDQWMNKKVGRKHRNFSYHDPIDYYNEKAYREED